MSDAKAPEPLSTPATAPLPAEPTPFARWKSRAKQALVARAFPKGVLVTRGKPSASGHERAVALTFDDGPDELTPRYLEVCAALRVSATFFLVGEHVERAPEMVLEYVRHGHEVAGHGYSHTALPTLEPGALVDELTRTGDLLPPMLARRPLLRPPYGTVTAASLARTALAGYTTVLWSLDSDDCRTRDPSVVVARVSPENVAPGEIILMHERRPWTLEALPAIVKGLRGAGFEFVTVSELLGY